MTAKAVAHDLKDMLRECKREGLMGCCSRSEGGLLPRYRSLPAVLRQQGLEDEAHLLQVLFVCLLEEFKELLVLMGEELLCLPIPPTGSLSKDELQQLRDLSDVDINDLYIELQEETELSPASSLTPQERRAAVLGAACGLPC